MNNNQGKHPLPIQAPPTSRPVRLKPVPAGYEPPYPDELTRDEIHHLLRPGLFRRFSPATMLAGALAAGAMAVGCEGPAGADGADGKTIRSTRSDPQLKARVDQIAEEILGPVKARNGWNERASIDLESPLSANPPVKTPRIPISFGNSYSGIFDTEAAKEATRKLFAAYGIELRNDVKLRGDGYEFVADGFDQKRRVGFKLIVPAGRNRLADQQTIQGPAASVLEAAELPALDKAVKAGELSIFVADASSFPKMDGDLFTPTQYYLASVIDYLNWVHGDRQIDLNKVLGRLPGGNVTRGHNRWWPSLPGADFEADADIDRWRVTKGKISVTPEWSSFGERALLVELEPGGEVSYTPPDGRPIDLRKDYAGFACGLYCPDQAASGTKVTATLVGDDGTSCRITAVLGARWLRWDPENQRNPAPPPRLAKLTIATDSARPIRFYIDDVGLQTQEQVDALNRKYKAAREAQAREDEARRRQEDVESRNYLLNVEVPAYEFDGVAARDILEHYADYGRWTFRVDWGSLRAAGVTPRSKVSLRGGPTRFGNMMDQFVAAAGAGVEYRIVDRVVHVSTANGFDRPRQVMLPPRGDARANEEAAERLRAPVPELNIDEAPLSDVLEFFAEVTGVKFDVAWAELEAAGVRRDQRVFMKDRIVPAGEALRLILLDAGAGHRPLTTCLHDGVLRIAPADAPAGARETSPGTEKALTPAGSPGAHGLP